MLPEIGRLVFARAARRAPIVGAASGCLGGVMMIESEQQAVHDVCTVHQSQECLSKGAQ
jgi:hypothetical protein